MLHLPKDNTTTINTTELETFIQAYVEAMFFTDISNPDNEEEFGEKGIEDFAPSTRERILQDCKAFYTSNHAFIKDHLEQAGHDFWLTRNGHGAGFWDREEIYGAQEAAMLTHGSKFFPEISPYVGDDGLIYLA